MEEKTVIKVEVDELIIEPKNGKVIDLENSDLSVGKIVFKKKENELPTKWEDLVIVKGYYLDSNCFIRRYGDEPTNSNKNIFPTKEEAEACLALSQLCQLRDAYNEEPLADWCDWRDGATKYSIEFYDNEITTFNYKCTRKVLTFKTKKLIDKFVKNFRELIEIAKPLL